MISRAQQILLKRAQAEARMEDEEYRDSIALVTGLGDCRSSTDRRLTDEHVDRLMKWFEFRFWAGVDAGLIGPGARGNGVFRVRGYWSSKNPKGGESSRDRYAEAGLQGKIKAAEMALQRAGKSEAYLAAIRRKTGGGWGYLAALRRTRDGKDGGGCEALPRSAGTQAGEDVNPGHVADLPATAWQDAGAGHFAWVNYE